MPTIPRIGYLKKQHFQGENTLHQTWQMVVLSQVTALK